MEFAVTFCMSSETMTVSNVFILIQYKTYGKTSYMKSNFYSLDVQFARIITCLGWDCHFQEKH